MASGGGGPPGGFNPNNQFASITAKMQALISQAHTMNQQEFQRKMAQLTQQMAALSTPKPTPPPQPPPTAPNLTVTQQQPLQGQQRNRAGGFSYVVDDMTQLKRFLTLGKENSSYTFQDTNSTITAETVPCVGRLIEAGRGNEVIDTIRKFAREARVAKDENLLIILSICALWSGKGMYDKNTTIQRAAYDSLVTVCNIPTKLFRFLELCEPTISKKWEPTPKPMSKTQLRKKKKQEERQLRQAAEAREREAVESSSGAKTKKKKKKKPKKPKVRSAKAKKSSGWGRQRRRGVAKFYTDENKDAERLLLLLTKFKSRHNWNHIQTLGYSHPKMTGEEKQAKDIVMKYCTRGYEKCQKYMKKNKIGDGAVNETTNRVIGHIKVLEEVKNLKSDNPNDRARMVQILKQFSIRQDHPEFTSLYFGQTQPIPNEEKKKSSFQITREHLPTGFQKFAEIWEAMLPDMPMTALIRNLGRMTSMGVFKKEGNIKMVENALSDPKHLRKARVHPIKVLLAAKTYAQGHGDDRSEYTQEQLKWQPEKRITNALDKAFYHCFKQADEKVNNDGTPARPSFKTGKKFMLALDVSGSMHFSGCYGCPQITPAMASTALALVTWNIEDHCSVYAFGGHFENIEDRLKKNMTIEQALAVGRKMNFGRTDCALPMEHARQNQLDIDVFIVYTDSDTWFGKVHPSEALKEYRRVMNKPEAKLIVLAMQSNNFSIADPKDKFMFDICGFDADVPDIICDFASGNLS